jgi:HSP20 family protein
MTLIKNNHRDIKEFIPRNLTDIIDNLFNEVSDAGVASTKFFPAADVAETEKNYEIHLALPGMKKEEIKIELHEGKLTVSGERKFEKDETGKKYYRLETQFGVFNRSFYLPDNIDGSSIEAAYSEGILTLIVPKDAKKSTRSTIAIF